MKESSAYLGAGTFCCVQKKQLLKRMLFVSSQKKLRRNSKFGCTVCLFFKDPSFPHWLLVLDLHFVDDQNNSLSLSRL
jgi:hypothetical protein